MVKTYEAQRDRKKESKDFDPKKVYNDEIMADMVNEMVKLYHTGIPEKYKKSISRQISEMDVMKPSQILSGEQLK